MKKNRVLRNWVITGIVGMLVTLIVLGLGVWFRDTACSVIGTNFVNGTNLNAIAWLPVFSKDYWTADGFLASSLSALFSTQGLFGNWTSIDFLADNIVWYVVALVSIVLFVVILVKAIKRKSGKHIGFAIFFLIFAILAVICTTAYYYARHLDYSYVDGVLTFNGFKEYVVYNGDKTMAWSMVAALTFGFYGDGLYAITDWQGITVSLLAYVLVLAILLSVVAYFGMTITALVQLRKKEEVVEEVPVVETTPEPEPTPVPEKKKAVLVCRRYDKYGNYGPLIDRGYIDYPKKEVTSKPLTIEEVRKAIKDEVEKAEARRIVEEYKNEKQAQAIAAAIVKATAPFHQAPVAPAAPVPPVSTAVEGKKPEEEKVYSAPVIFAMPSSVREEYVKEAEKKPAAPVAPLPKKENKGLTEDQVKEIIASEIKDALKDLVIKHEKIVEKHVEIKVPAKEEPKVEETVVEEPKEEKPTEEVKETVVETAPVVEEPKAEETPTEVVKEETPVVEETTPTETVVETPVAEETAPVAPTETVPTEEEVKEETPSVETPVTAKEEEKVAEDTTAESTVEETPIVETPTEEKPKIIRIPFTTRMLEADDELKSAYNHIKSLLKSYGLNNRVANGGDSFRLHRVTYCKITVAGKSLKLYLALDPKDYVDTTYPIKDASSKNMYKETPLVFKVKSGLSLRRADELIRDCMDKHGFEQIDQVQEKDWASELANVTVEDDGDEGDEE